MSLRAPAPISPTSPHHSVHIHRHPHGLTGAPTRPYRSIEGCGGTTSHQCPPLGDSQGESPTSKYGIVSHRSLPSPAGVPSQCESRAAWGISSNASSERMMYRGCIRAIKLGKPCYLRHATCWLLCIHKISEQNPPTIKQISLTAVAAKSTDTPPLFAVVVVELY